MAARCGENCLTVLVTFSLNVPAKLNEHISCNLRKQKTMTVTPRKGATYILVLAHFNIQKTNKHKNIQEHLRMSV